MSDISQKQHFNNYHSKGLVLITLHNFIKRFKTITD